jgi:polar amino acid transport system ATP-binding protein
VVRRSFKVLTSISATVPKGSTVVLCGPSGSGKSTLARTVNRLEPIQEGRIIINGADIHAAGVDVNTLRTGIGFVFQQFNLFPHLTVLENVMLPLQRIAGSRESRRADQRWRCSTRVGLGDERNRFRRTYPAASRSALRSRGRLC